MVWQVCSAGDLKFYAPLGFTNHMCSITNSLPPHNSMSASRDGTPKIGWQSPNVHDDVSTLPLQFMKNSTNFTDPEKTWKRVDAGVPISDEGQSILPKRGRSNSRPWLFYSFVPIRTGTLKVAVGVGKGPVSSPLTVNHLRFRTHRARTRRSRPSKTGRLKTLPVRIVHGNTLDRLRVACRLCILSFTFGVFRASTASFSTSITNCHDFGG